MGELRLREGKGLPSITQSVSDGAGDKDVSTGRVACGEQKTRTRAVGVAAWGRDPGTQREERGWRDSGER